MFQKADLSVVMQRVYHQGMALDPKDVEALRREKYGNNAAADMTADLARLRKGEPLAYVIGNIPFLGLTIDLFSHPLIPRPETEWWVEELASHIGDKQFKVLDLCAGSGAIGLALLKLCPNVQVSFGELMEEHDAVIKKNIKDNGLDASRADVRSGDLFTPFTGTTFDIIATNPPYIPSIRSLDEGVTRYEPSEALFAGTDGMDVIRRICAEAPQHLKEKGELWMECDISNIEPAAHLAIEAGASYTKIRTDQYQRPRLLVAYY